MRLKTINIQDRSESFSNETSDLVKNITSDINKISLIFDKFLEIESFIMFNVIEEFEDFVEIRNNRIEIEKDDDYLNNYFKPAALKLEKKINDMTEEWNLMNEEFNADSICRICGTLKSFRNFINELLNSENTCLDTIETIGKIVDDFGRFQSIGAMVGTNIVDKIESLLASKENILKIKEDPKFLDEINIDDLSIDDL